MVIPASPFSRPAASASPAARAPELERRLHEAAARGDCGAIRRLALCGVDIEARDENGFTAFNIATRNSRPEAALTLLAAKEAQYMRSLGVEPEDFLVQKELSHRCRDAARAGGGA
jgi:hypothetical protein